MRCELKPRNLTFLVGQKIRVPAIIRESGSTTVLGSDTLAQVDSFRNLLIHL